MRHAISGHGHTLRSCFASILSLADYLLRSGELSLRRYGVQVYTLAFRHFSDTYHRQEVLGALMAHIGSGAPHEVDGTVDIFEMLSKDDGPRGCLQLAAYASFIDVRFACIAPVVHFCADDGNVEML